MTKIQEQNATVEKHNKHLIDLMQADPQASKWLTSGDYAKAAAWLNTHPEGRMHRANPWKPNGLARMVQAKLGSKAVVRGVQRVLERKGKLTNGQLGEKIRRLYKELPTQLDVAQALNDEGIAYYGRGGEAKPWDGKRVSDFLRRFGTHRAVKESQPSPAPVLSSKVERSSDGNTLLCSYSRAEGKVEIELRYSGSDDSDEASGLRALLEQLKIFVA
jgi:hypothetical protein